MIHLTKGQKLFNNEGLVVCDPTGYYEDGASVTCAAYHSPEEPVFRYEAKYIAYGDQVYNITDEENLLEEIKKIDPNTLLGKTAKDVNLDKLIEEIQTVDNPTPELVPDNTETSETPETPETIPETTPEVPIPEVVPIVENPVDLSTTTSPVLEEIIPSSEDTSTTTPDILEKIEEATSTVSEIVATAKKRLIKKIKA